MISLPQKLNKEPIIDALFEIRFTTHLSISEILPGLLYSALPGQKFFVPLINAQIPKLIREKDPNLQFTPVSRLDWKNVLINISDHSISIACKLPYPGWKHFKKSIEEILDVVKENKIIESIERYSIKYVNLIHSDDLKNQINSLNLDMTIAGHKLEEEIFQIKVEIPQNNFINVITLVSSASVKLPDQTVQKGIVVDIDSICRLNNISIQDLLENFSSKLDSIHSVSKNMFFSCLKQKTIDILGVIK